MAIKYWMISDRNVTATGLGGNLAPLTYWTAEAGADLTDLKSWSRTQFAAFKRSLLELTKTFPVVGAGQNEQQKHVTLFIHGYNTGWLDAINTYRKLNDTLFTGAADLGVCVLFSWPSKGSPAEYLPDQESARLAANDLADVLTALYDILQTAQARGARNPQQACQAKTSIIAHSLGNFLVQRAAKIVWTRKNEALLVSLLNQLLMVAADVDNDLFKSGERIDKSDGDALANLTYRITALYSGLDQVLGASAGLKHFGKRRLGRSGLDRTVEEPDNVWDIDCTPLFAANPPIPPVVHSAYFDDPSVLKLMEDLLRGVDRKILTLGADLMSSVRI